MKHPTPQETKVGLKIFFDIMEAWAQPIESQMKFIGLDDADEFAKLEEQPSPNISQENLIRISYLMKTHRYLHTIFESKGQADAWVNKPNKRYEGHQLQSICVCMELRALKMFASISFHCADRVLLTTAAITPLYCFLSSTAPLVFA